MKYQLNVNDPLMKPIKSVIFSSGNIVNGDLAVIRKKGEGFATVRQVFIKGNKVELHTFEGIDRVLKTNQLEVCYPIIWSSSRLMSTENNRKFNN